MANTADKVERRYMDRVYAYLLTTDDPDWERLSEEVHGAWEGRLAHESRQLTARAHAASEQPGPAAK
eukprot:6113109-Pyramimonas_sp.AAC.1